MTNVIDTDEVHMEAQKKSNRRRRQRGMTLIEIMVVVTILGLIAAAVGVAVIPKLGEARVSQVYVDFKTIQTGLDAYKIRKGSYPQSLDALVPGDLKEPAIDPWGHPYQYVLEGGKPVVSTLGADNNVGGEGEDADIASNQPRTRSQE